jgi:hypothetical protein
LLKLLERTGTPGMEDSDSTADTRRSEGMMGKHAGLQTRETESNVKPRLEEAQLPQEM